MSTKTARFDTRLSTDQKEFFEYAASLAGFKSLSEFVISAVQEKASFVVKQNEQILANERDREIFFDALLNPPKPNAQLLKAAQEHREMFG